MKSVSVTVHDKEGLHARPAGVLNKKAKEFQSTCTITKEDGKSGDLKKIFAIMGMAIKCGNVLTLTCDGPDEDAALEALKAIFDAEL